MTINYSEKIEKINNDRILMLTAVKKNMTNNGQSLISNLDIVIEKLAKDETNTKKYKSIIKAKELILELTEQIINANSIEEITKLRKRVNYYINKITKELKERKMDDELVNNIYNSVDYLRTDMTKYIRYLKRIDNIIKIDNLHKNFDNLSKDESIELKKLLSNEERYNKRFNSSINNYQKKEHKYVEKSKKKVRNNDDVDVLKLNFYDFINRGSMNSPITHTDSTDTTFLKERVEYYLNLYKFPKYTQYDGSLGSKISTVFYNVKNYLNNKKIMSIAERDYNVYYHGEDLAYFIAYFNKRNSIRFCLQLLLNQSNLSKREIECLLDHEKCFNWITEFCISRDSNAVMQNEQSVCSTKAKIRFINKKSSPFFYTQ